MTLPRNPRSPRPAILAAAILTLVLAACGGDDNGSSTTPTTLPGAGAGAATVVDIVNAGSSWKYDPESVSVPAGSAVTWTNSTDVPHNVVFSDSSSVKSSNLFPKGKSFTATFPAAGAYPYICSVHPDMKGTVVAT